MNNLIRRLAAVLVLPVLTSCAGRTQEPSLPPRADLSLPFTPSTDNTQLYTPSGLELQIAFWRNVYSVWGLGQMALHDDRYPNLVYEVIELPDLVQDGYTTSQREFIREQQAFWKARLSELERKVASGEPLSLSESALAARITSSAGSAGVFGAAERLRGQRGQRERFKRGLEISKRYDAIFKDIFRKAGLPEDLAYLPHVESSFQAYARSSAGAAGIWQFTKPAARIYLNNHPALDERLDPVASAQGAARYLRDAYDNLGDWALAVTSYNHGISGMTRAKQYFGTDFMKIVHYYDHPAFGFASRNFYAEFLAAREIARQPARFFPEGVRYEVPLNWDRVVLNQPTPASQLAFFYGIDKQHLIAMNPAWTEAAALDQIALPEGTEIWLPNGTLARVAQLNRASDNVALADKPSATEP